MSEKTTQIIEIEHEPSPQLDRAQRVHTQTITLSEGEHHHYLKHFGTHGTETFEDVILHPKREWKAHKMRQAQLKARKASGASNLEQDFEIDSETGSIVPTPKEILIHIKRMNGSHTFKFEEKSLNTLAVGAHLSAEEKSGFEATTDSDELRRHCIDTHRAVKLVFDSDVEPDDDTKFIVLNDNIILEIRPVDFNNDLERLYINPKREFFKIPDADLSDNLGEKSAQWLELFYDLFYIVSLSQFTHDHHIIDVSSFLIYAGWFVILWWAWLSSAMYTTRFDTNDVVHHIFKLIEMYGIVGMASASTKYYEEDSMGFTLAYMILKLVLILEYSLIYFYAYWDVKKIASIRPLRFFLLANVISITMWGASLAVKIPGKFGLWYGSIAVEVFVNLWFRHNKETSVAKSHLGERIGLLTLIVLGENVIGLVRLLASESNVILILCEMMGVTILFGFFYIYFDDFSKDVLSEAKSNYIWIFAHFPLHLFQISVGIALTDLIIIERQSISPVAASDEKAVSHLGMMFERAIEEPVANSTSTSTSTDQHDSPDVSHLNSTFVANTFLVSAALVLFVNAVIKMLHSQLAEKNSVIIIVIRLFTVVVLFALVAVPYAMWGSALALLGFMTGMMVLQAGIDYLD